jgi:predicted PurR-regulated permease PerM
MRPGHRNSSSRDSLGWLARRTLVVVVIVGLVWLAWRMVNAFLLAFLGILLATLYRGFAHLVSRYSRISTEWALLAVALLFLGLIALFIRLAGPSINRQMGQMAKTLPGTVKQMEKAIEQSTVGRYVLRYVRQAAAGPGAGARLVSRVSGIATTIYEIGAYVLLVIISALYFSVNPAVYRRGILLLIPKGQSTRIAEVLEQTAYILRYWLLGQFILMIFAGLMVTASMWLIGVPLAFVLGIISGLLEFIPVIGPILGAVPGILIATTGGWLKALEAALLYFLIQETESNVLVPLIQKQTVEVPPALVMVALVAFGLLFGFLGILVATPLTAIVIVWVKMLYVEDVLGKHTEPG